MVRQAVLPLAVWLLAAGQSLPGWAETDASLRNALNCEGRWAQSPLCMDRRDATNLRGRYDSLHATIAAVSDPPWPASALQRAEAQYQSGMALYQDQRFGESLPRLRDALAGLKALNGLLAEAREQARQQAEAALLADNVEAARGHWLRLLNWDPEDAEALAGIQALDAEAEAAAMRADVLALIESGDLAAAEAALLVWPTPDRDSAWRALRGRIESIRRQARFDAEVSAGYAHLEAGRLDAAEAAFDRALSIRPEVVLIQETLAEIRQRLQRNVLRRAQADVEAALRAQDWAAAEAALAARIEAGASDQAEAARAQLAEVQGWREMEARLDRYLAEPQAIAREPLRSTVAELLSSAAQAEAGDRIAAKTAQLRATFNAWTTPVRVVLNSDNLTDVRIRPNTRLGKFRTRTFDILPGDYVLSGIRKGYRETLIYLSLKPGDAAMELTIRCQDRF